MRILFTAALLAVLPTAAMADAHPDVIRGSNRTELLRQLERQAGRDRAPLIRARLKAERARLLALPADRFTAELNQLLIALTGDDTVRVAAGA